MPAVVNNTSTPLRKADRLREAHQSEVAMTTTNPTLDCNPAAMDSRARDQSLVYDCNSNEACRRTDYGHECEPFIVTVVTESDDTSPRQQRLLSLAGDVYILLRSVENAAIVQVIDTRLSILFLFSNLL